MNIITAFSNVWSELLSFISSTWPSITSLFYDATNGLTFAGVLAVIMCGISLILLCFNLLRSFFTARG